LVSNDAPLGYGIGSSTVTWKAKDASGNTVTAAQTVTIVDTTSPTIVAPADIMINSTGALTSISIGSAIVNDRVDPSPLVTNNAPANGFPVGKTTVTWTATDASGNYAKAAQLVSIQSTTAYTIPTIGGVRPTAVTYGSTVHTVCKTGCNYTSISSAIDALPADGGKVLIKSGNYALTSTINLRSHMLIEFQNGAVVTHSASGKIFSGDNINNVMFINPVITQFGAPYDAIYITNGNNIIV